MSVDILLILENIGIASAAVSGFLFAVRKKCDWLGIFIASFLTALGGGILRDMIVGRPIYSFTHYLPVINVIVMIIFCGVMKFYKVSKHEKIEKKPLFIMSDAIDFVSFSIVGAMVALHYEYNIFGVILVAFCNGVGGGILRDVLLNEIPWMLHTGLYGTISMLVGFIYFFMDKFDATNIYFVMLLFTAGVVFRMFAYYKSWHLPEVRYEK